jgi:hypothetical protein
MTPRELLQITEQLKFLTLGRDFRLFGRKSLPSVEILFELFLRETFPLTGDDVKIKRRGGRGEGESSPPTLGGWGRLHVDAFGRPLYGGDPFGSPKVKYKGGGGGLDSKNENLYRLSGSFAMTMMMMAGGGDDHDYGKAIKKKPWGLLLGAFGDGRGRGEGDDNDEGEGSLPSGEEPVCGGGILTTSGGAAARALGMDSVLPDSVDSGVPSSAVDLRKPGDERGGTAQAAVHGPAGGRGKRQRATKCGLHVQSHVRPTRGWIGIGHTGGSGERPVEVGRDRRQGRRKQEG